MPQNMTHKVKYGDNIRESFSKIKEVLDMPYLLEAQTDSYKEFITKGIQNVLDDFSPVVDRMGRFKLYFLGFTLEGTPKYTLKECHEGDHSYTLPLYVKVRLERTETGEVIEDKVFMGDIPLMTDNGAFVINGADRVIVSQLVRSPSVYNTFEKDSKTGEEIYSTQVMPQRGAWIEFKQDQHGVISVAVDRKRKFPATILIRNLLTQGTNEELIELFGDEEFLRKTIEKDGTTDLESAKREFYSRQRPGEEVSDEGIKTLLNNLFFDDKRYDLMKVGRYKINKKLSLAYRIEGLELAEDAVTEDGEVVVQAKKAGYLKIEDARKIQNAGINSVRVISINGETVKVLGNKSANIVDYAKNLGIKISDKVLVALFGENSEYDDQIIYTPAFDKIITEHKTSKAFEEYVLKNTIEASKLLIVKCLTPDDILSSFSNNLGLSHGVGKTDVIDHLANRRVRCVGELLENQFHIGISRLEKQIKENMARTQESDDCRIQQFINIKPVSAVIKEFFCSSPLSQFMDHHNPIAELTNKRKLSALGPGGLSRERAGFEVRDINHTHYGRLCPIETPEGQNIGLISSFASYAKVNKYGFIEAPYRKVDKEKGIVTNEVRYLQADEEDNYIVAQANTPLNEDGSFADDRVMCRIKEDIREVDKSRVDYMDVSPKQLISVASALIPFLENDDTARALMGSNMQRQAVPLLKPESPMIATGIEYKIAHDSGVLQLAKNDGVVKSVSADKIVVTTVDGEDVYNLQKFERSNAGTCITQKPIVSKGQKVIKDMVLADGPATQNGELSLGRNILIGYMSWEGYNYEDAILINEDLVKDDVFTSIHIEKFETSAREINKLGSEQITRDIPGLSDEALKNLDEDGIVRIGAEVNSGDILVGKTTPKGETEPSAQERLLRSIFGDKSKDVKDTSTRVPHGQSGVVIGVKVFTKKNKEDMEPGVNKQVRVYVAQKRKIGVGDKMSGRHGNKGVISRVLPREDMPFLADGTRLQIVLNPLGVPSRMNIGQVLEVHLGYVAKKLGLKIATPVFDGAKESDIKQLLKENNLPENGKFIVYDGRTGEAFENPVTVGYMYMLKLCHMVDEKMHARSIGPYSLITQQPLGGKAQFGGQRFGEMEVWALEAYGAAHILQEVLTIKSDDVTGRSKAYEAIARGNQIAEPSTPESFKVLVKEMQAIGLDVRIQNEHGAEVDSITNFTDPADTNQQVFSTDSNQLQEQEISLDNLPDVDTNNNLGLDEKINDNDNNDDSFMNIFEDKDDKDPFSNMFTNGDENE